jgi:hypothetical protein
MHFFNQVLRDESLTAHCKEYFQGEIVRKIMLSRARSEAKINAI